MRNTKYQIISKTDSRKLTDFLSQQGQLFLPAVGLITQAKGSGRRTHRCYRPGRNRGDIEPVGPGISRAEASRQKGRRYQVVWQAGCDDGIPN